VTDTGLVDATSAILTTRTLGRGRKGPLFSVK
jgi:hypothetical protein